MNNQLHQLEKSVNRLAVRFNTITIENRQLARQVTLLQQQKQQQLADFQVRQEELTQKYEQKLHQLQENLHQQITDLVTEKRYYQQVLNSTCEEINQLLQRLPVSKQEG